MARIGRLAPGAAALRFFESENLLVQRTARELHNRARMEKRVDLLGILAGAAGGAVAIAVMELLSTASGYSLMAVPFATSIVLVMGTPEAEPAQPRALVGGHVLATIVGLCVLKLAGPTPWAAALAVGLAMAAMHATRSFHPPAGIDPLVVVTNNMPWSFLLVPVGVGVVLLAIFALLWHNLIRRGSWPARWW
jgi:CBS-domain-containing membrane protein